MTKTFISAALLLVSLVAHSGEYETGYAVGYKDAAALCGGQTWVCTLTYSEGTIPGFGPTKSEAVSNAVDQCNLKISSGEGLSAYDSCRASSDIECRAL